jgi:hypothetical protein
MRKQIESEHENEPLFSCSLLLQGQKEPLYLAKRRGAGMEKRGIIEDSLRPVWVKPGHLLQISWQTHGRNSIGTRLLLAKEADDWRLLYRDSVRTSNGNIGMGFGIYTKFGFSYCEATGTLTLCHTTDAWHTSMKPQPLFEATGEAYSPYSTKYTYTSRWPCRITNGELEIKPGVYFISFAESEFPIEEVAGFVAQWTS